MVDYNNESVEELQNNLSKINSAGLVNSTISNLWNDFFRHYRNGEFLSANADLDCLWTIFGGEKGMDGTESEEKYNLIEQELSSSGRLKDSLEITGFNKVGLEQIKTFGKHKEILMNKSLFLRRLMNEQGKGTAYQSGDDEETE